jgi:uncharacterized iron-regulated membrane protein
MVLFEIAAAIVILAQRQGRAFGAGRQIFAIVTLIGTGLFFYGRMLWTAVAAGIQASARQPVNTAPILRASAQFDLAVALLLGVAGLAVLVFEKSPGQQQGSIVS